MNWLLAQATGNGRAFGACLLASVLVGMLIDARALRALRRRHRVIFGFARGLQTLLIRAAGVFLFLEPLAE